MKLILIAIVLSILIYLSKTKLLDISINYILILAILFIKLTYDTTSLEHLTDVDALANVASLYNNQNMKVTNLEVTGNLTVGGATKTGSLITPVIAPVEVGKSTGTLSIWGEQIYAPSSSFTAVQIPGGNLAVAGNATIGGDAIINGFIRNSKGLTTEMVPGSGTVVDLPIWAKNINLTPLSGGIVNIAGKLTTSDTVTVSSNAPVGSGGQFGGITLGCN